METLALLLILSGLGILRQVSIGRAADIPTDAQDMAVAIFQGRIGDVSGITTRRGASPAASSGSQSAGEPAPSGSALATAQRLGAGKPYLLGAEGPDAYDCSGLVWRALYVNGTYTGQRFTTHNFESVAPKFATRVSDPQVGDIVVWPTHHMGFVAGNDLMFSAYNHDHGIITTPLHTEPSNPHYWRING
jgi:cell wall-associated NlpC family hydrolase